jgi:hypothetical protein
MYLFNSRFLWIGFLSKAVGSLRKGLAFSLAMQYAPRLIAKNYTAECQLKSTFFGYSAPQLGSIGG